MHLTGYFVNNHDTVNNAINNEVLNLESGTFLPSRGGGEIQSNESVSRSSSLVCSTCILFSVTGLMLWAQNEIYFFITVDYMLFGWEYNTINFILHNAFHTSCIWNALQSKTVQVQSFVITGEGKKTQILEFEKVTLEDIQKKLKYKKISWDSEEGLG